MIACPACIDDRLRHFGGLNVCCIICTEYVWDQCGVTLNTPELLKRKTKKICAMDVIRVTSCTSFFFYIIAKLRWSRILEQILVAQSPTGYCEYGPYILMQYPLTPFDVVFLSQGLPSFFEPLIWQLLCFPLFGKLSSTCRAISGGIASIFFARLKARCGWSQLFFMFQHQTWYCIYFLLIVTCFVLFIITNKSTRASGLQFKTWWIMDPLIYHSPLKYPTFVCGRDLSRDVCLTHKLRSCH